MQTELQNETQVTSMEKEIETLKKDNAQLLKELDFHKNQFNSHITLNFLTYCYAYLHRTSEECAENLAVFADMIKYSYQISPEVPISLRREIEYIENFISIQRCITTDVFANFQYEGCIDDKKIVPRILITFVENAFKYGQFYNENHPIEIYLLATPKDILLRVNNKKIKPSKTILAHTNSQGTKQMLNSFFNDKYQLKINDSELEYSVEVIFYI